MGLPPVDRLALVDLQSNYPFTRELETGRLKASVHREGRYEDQHSRGASSSIEFNSQESVNPRASNHARTGLPPVDRLVLMDLQHDPPLTGDFESGYLRVLLWNYEGFTGVCTHLSLHELKGLDVIILTETFATSISCLPGFYAACCPARKKEGPGRPSGGVTIFYNDRLRRPQILLAEDDCVVVASQTACFAGIYVRPDPVETTMNMIHRVTSCLETVQSEGALRRRRRL